MKHELVEKNRYYKCSCGAEFYDIDDIYAHFEAIKDKVSDEARERMGRNNDI